MISKEEIFEALADWNYWDKPHPRTVPRQDNENEIDRKAASGESIILKGVRRSGKSTLMINEIKRLMKHHENKVFLIWDGHSIHKSGQTKTCIASFDGRLEVFLLPSYSPDLNPIEQLWHHTKGNNVGQFNVLYHALCWVHAERLIGKIVAFTDQAQKELADVKEQIWNLYNDLKEYKLNPNAKDSRRLKETFDTIFTSKITSATLNEALKRIHKNKAELLLVLERPDIPLHNNSAENAIREYVKRRKISGGARSELGRLARDTFTSLKKTCRKLGILFWQYLKDRIENIGFYPTLSSLIKERALNGVENNRSVKLPVNFSSSADNSCRDIPKYVPIDETNHKNS
jgi:transposase